MIRRAKFVTFEHLENFVSFSSFGLVAYRHLEDYQPES